MTYATLRVLTCPTPLTKDDLQRGDLKNAIFEDLDNCARDCATALSRWAQEKNLPVYNVDNCWERVLVSGKELRYFYTEMLPAGRFEYDLFEQVIDSDHYIIESEEF
jgi:hypothetical protein